MDDDAQREFPEKKTDDFRLADQQTGRNEFASAGVYPEEERGTARQFVGMRQSAR